MEQEEGQYENLYVSPIANPIAGDRLRKKILILTKKLIAHKMVKRGVKECVKAIRKNVKGMCIFAADVDPVDVYSHIPILCQQNGLPYIFIRSRMQLGGAACTKKPTSVIILVQPTQKNQLYEKYNTMYMKIKKENPFL